MVPFKFDEWEDDFQDSLDFDEWEDEFQGIDDFEPKSFVEKTKRAGKNIGASAAQGIGDIVRSQIAHEEQIDPEKKVEAIGDYLEWLDPYTTESLLPAELYGASKEEKKKYFKKEHEKFLKEAGEFVEDLPKPGKPGFKGGVLGTVEKGATGVARFAGPMAMSAIPGIGMAMGTGATFTALYGDKHSQLKKEGKSDEVANGAAALHAVLATPAEMAGNVLQIKALKGIFGPAKNRLVNTAKQLLRGATGEGFEEGIQGLTEAYADIVANMPDASNKKRAEAYLDLLEDPKFRSNIYEQMGTGAVGGALLPGIGTMVKAPFDVGSWLSEHQQVSKLSESDKQEWKKVKALPDKIASDKEKKMWLRSKATGKGLPTHPEREKVSGLAEEEESLNNQIKEVAEEERHLTEDLDAGFIEVDETKPAVTTAKGLKAGLTGQQVESNRVRKKATAKKRAIEKKVRKQRKEARKNAELRQIMVAQEQARQEALDRKLDQQHQQAVERQHFLQQMQDPVRVMNLATEAMATEEEAEQDVKPLREAHKAVKTELDNVGKLATVQYNLDEFIQSGNIGKLDWHTRQIATRLKDMVDQRVTNLKINEQLETLRKAGEERAAKEKTRAQAVEKERTQASIEAAKGKQLTELPVTPVYATYG
jgi:hypothetical protein